uniref:UBZ4-type domain-containing protein n=1 Tax=Timema douglasi TaxID=61478 RepID=A0A7R8VA85_TIMDO|nr:unnamed protein product [Timema douglasi]
MTDQGLLDDGMSFEDKKNVLKMIQESEDMARTQESVRTVSNTIKPQILQSTLIESSSMNQNDSFDVAESRPLLHSPVLSRGRKNSLQRRDASCLISRKKGLEPNEINQLCVDLAEEEEQQQETNEMNNDEDENIDVQTNTINSRLKDNDKITSKHIFVTLPDTKPVQDPKIFDNTQEDNAEGKSSESEDLDILDTTPTQSPDLPAHKLSLSLRNAKKSYGFDRQSVNKNSLKEAIFEDLHELSDEGTNRPKSADDLFSEMIQSSSEPCVSTSKQLPKNRDIERKNIFDHRYTKDKKRNIDVFNCKRHNYEPPKLGLDRFPFSSVGKTLDIHSFTDLFKKHIDSYLKQLVDVQRNSIEYMDWGKPIPIIRSIRQNSEKRGTRKGPSLSNYNFRERQQSLRPNDAYDFSDSEDSTEESTIVKDKMYRAGEEKGLSDEIFTLSREKRKYGAKEVQESQSSVSSQNVTPAVSPKKMKMSYPSDNDSNSQEKFGEESDEDFEPPSLRKQRKPGKRGVSRGKVTKKAIDTPTSKPIRRRQLTNKGKNCDTKAALQITVEESPSTSILDERTVNENDIEMNSQEDLQTLSQNNLNKASSPDLTVLYDKQTVANDEQANMVPCPICRKMFEATEIEAHASECDQYFQEKELNEEKINMRPRRPPQLSDG